MIFTGGLSHVSFCLESVRVKDQLELSLAPASGVICTANCSGHDMVNICYTLQLLQ